MTFLEKKEVSRRLDIQVRWFLRKQKRKEAEQIEFGRSLHLEDCKAKGINPWMFSLENRMQSDIAEAHAEHAKKQKTANDKPVKPEPIYTPDNSSDESRIMFNRNAREKAVANDSKKFMGRCKKHGQQIFTVKKGGRDHLCLICQRKFSNTQNEKRRKQKMESL